MKNLAKITITYDAEDTEHIKKLEEAYITNKPIRILAKDYKIDEIVRSEYMRRYDLIEFKRHKSKGENKGIDNLLSIIMLSGLMLIIKQDTSLANDMLTTIILISIPLFSLLSDIMHAIKQEKATSIFVTLMLISIISLTIIIMAKTIIQGTILWIT